MAIWDLVLIERALLAALGPLAGSRAEGNVIVTATGADVTLPPFTYGIPVIGGKPIYSKMFRVVPSTPINVRSEGWTIDNGGTSVPVRAVCGGTEGNVPEIISGEPVRFLLQPPIAGLLPYGTIGPGGLTGGVREEGPGFCKRVVLLDSLPQGEATKNIWEAQGEGFPALVLSYLRGSTEQAVSVASERIAEQLRIHIISANYAGDDERSIESKLLISAVRDILTGLADFEGEVFAGPPCEMGAATRLPFAPSAHVFAIDVTVSYVPERTDTRLGDGVSWQPWQTTRIQIAEAATETQAAKVIEDVMAVQEQ